MMKTAGILVAVLMSGCSLYGGTDPVDADALDGEWSMRVNLNPCVATPAPVTVEFEINSGELGRIAVVGDVIEAQGFVPEESLVWINTETASWDLTIWDDGVVAGALVLFQDDGGCTVEIEPDFIERVR